MIGLTYLGGYLWHIRAWLLIVVSCVLTGDVHVRKDYADAFEKVELEES